MVLAGIFPVLLSAIAASGIMWYAVPAGFSCRNVWIVAIFFLWIASAAITTGAHVWIDRKTRKRETAWGLDESRDCFLPSTGDSDGSETDIERRIWKWIILKDAIVAIVCGLRIFLSTAGVFNSCYCWTDYMTKKDRAVIPMNTDEINIERAQSIYSGIIITCIGLQVLFFFAIAWYWRRGLSLVRWHEEDRLREWEYETGENTLWSPLKYFIFWYYKDELDAEENHRERKASEYEMSRRPSYFKEALLRASLSWTSRKSI